MENWIFTSLDTLMKVIISILAIFTFIILIARVFGLRTFAKMSSFDFASTIAVGSILASVVLNSNQSILKGAIALVGIIAFQAIFSICKRRSSWFNSIFTNKPMMLMHDGKFIEKNLKKTNVSTKDVYAKLREANVKDMSEVLAVVMESTGDISVIHNENIDAKVADEILTGVEH